MKAKWLDRSLFISSQYYTICTNEKQFKQVLRHMKIPKENRPPFLKNRFADASTHFFVNEDGKSKTAVVCLGDTKGRDPNQVRALIVHEAMHIWQEVKADYGEHNPGNEVEAYSVQMLTQQLFYEYDRQTSPKSQ